MFMGNLVQKQGMHTSKKTESSTEPLKDKESTWKSRWKDSKGHMWWVTPKKQSLSDTTRLTCV